MKDKIWSIAKIALAGVFIGLCVKLLPLIDILYLFAMIVCVPLALALALDIISVESYKLVTEGINDLRDRTKRRRAEIDGEPTETEEVAAA